MSRLIKKCWPVLILGAGVFLLPFGSSWGQNPPTKADKPVGSIAFSPDGQWLSADVNGNVAVWDAATGRQVLTDALVGRLIDRGDETFGASLQPVAPVLRAQLNIPAGQGLLVASLRAGGPSEQAGLKPNDILLSLAEKPLASVEDLTRALKAVGERPAPLKLLRDGKPTVIDVRPIYHVTLGPAQERKMEYYIGVNISPLDEVVRHQLGMSRGAGVVVTDVIKGSPAEKAGIQKYDIILGLDGKQIDKPEALAHLVQANRDKPLNVTLMRARHTMQVQLTAAAREVAGNPDSQTLRLYLSDLAHFNPTAYQNLQLNPSFQSMPNLQLRENLYSRLADPNFQLSRTGAKFQAQLDHLDKELKALRRIEAIEKEIKDLHQELEKLRATLKK